MKADTDKKIKAIAVVHNETATGVTSDLPKIRETIDACGHPALFMVDGVSSIGALDFQMDKWKVDIAVTGSQKALSLPTGLAVVAVSDKVMLPKATSCNPDIGFLPLLLHMQNQRGTIMQLRTCLFFKQTVLCFKDVSRCLCSTDGHKVLRKPIARGLHAVHAAPAKCQEAPHCKSFVCHRMVSCSRLHSDLVLMPCVCRR